MARMQRSKAFTLIELLVVVSIIALLVSILMPALGRAREQAKAVVCQSHLKEWGTILLLYATDYNDRFFPGPGVSPDRRWPEILIPYYSADRADDTTASEIRCCPVATTPVFDEDGNPTGAKHPRAAWGIFAADTGYQVAGHMGSFGVNWWLCDVPETAFGTYFPKKHPELFDDPFSLHWRTTAANHGSEVPMFADMGYYGAWPNDEDTPAYYSGDLASGHIPNGMRQVCLDRHNLSVNVVFLDQSSRRTSLKDLWRIRWHRGFDVGLPEQDWAQQTDGWLK